MSLPNPSAEIVGNVGFGIDMVSFLLIMEIVDDIGSAKRVRREQK